MELWTKIFETYSDMAGTLLMIAGVSLYICAKTILWWLVFGFVGLFRGQYTVSKWCNRTLCGLIGMAALIAGNVALWLTYTPGEGVHRNICIVLLLLSYRVAWREFFTIGGLVRGDWSLSDPNLRFFAWNRFLRFSFPLKLIFGGDGSSSKKSYSFFDDPAVQHWYYQQSCNYRV